ncbi:MAG: hypothetical protein HUJ63_08785, partial [Enterococcus sp.]|nr:hypothetical protein [Enterococcus sp.]
AKDEKLKLEKNVSKLEEQDKKIEDELNSVIEEISSLRVKSEDGQDALQRIQAEILSLTELDKKLSTSNFPGRTWILDNTDSLKLKVQALSHLLKVDDKYAQALESALGSHLSALIVGSDDKSSILETISNKAKAGVVLKIAKEHDANVNLNKVLTDVKKKDSSACALLDMIEVKDEAKNYLKKLLEDVIYVEDLFASLRKSIDFSDMRVVDSYGNIIDKTGTLYLKANKNSNVASKGSIALASKIRKLKAQETKLSKEVEGIDSNLNKAREREDKLHAQRLELSEEIATVKARLQIEINKESELAKQIEILNSDLKKALDKEGSISTDIEQSSPAIDKLSKSLKEDEEELKVVFKKIDEIEG